MLETFLKKNNCFESIMLDSEKTWHHDLMASQSDKLESLQKRALRIIHGDFAVGKSYEFLVSFSKIEPLFERRTTIGKTTRTQ